MLGSGCPHTTVLAEFGDEKASANRVSCWPPPVFVPLITVTEVAVFVYYHVTGDAGAAGGHVPVDSPLIYRPDRRHEVWRFVTYGLLHAGWLHLLLNMFIQLLVGLPLELVHGPHRIGPIYLAGIIAGSLGTSVLRKTAYLVGASGGVYALLAAHLANILLNYSEMKMGLLKVAMIFVIAGMDVGFALWSSYGTKEGRHPIGYTAHVVGSVAGLSVATLLLRQAGEPKHYVTRLRWLAVVVVAVIVIVAVLCNIFA